MGSSAWTERAVWALLSISTPLIVLILPLLIWRRFASLNVDGVNVWAILLIAMASFLLPLLAGLIAHKLMDYEKALGPSYFLLLVTVIFTLFVVIKIGAETLRLLSVDIGQLAAVIPSFSVLHSIVFILLFFSSYILARIVK